MEERYLVAYQHDPYIDNNLELSAITFTGEQWRNFKMVRDVENEIAKQAKVINPRVIAITKLHNLLDYAS